MVSSLPYKFSPTEIFWASPMGFAKPAIDKYYQYTTQVVMFFFTELKKESLSQNLGFGRYLRGFYLPLLFIMMGFGLMANPDNSDTEKVPSWSDYVPEKWQEDIYVPSLLTSVSLVSIAPAASGVPGNSDVIVRYTVKNDGTETLNCIQIAFDLKNQIGVPPFVALTGSLSARTGSGFVFGPPITGSASMVYGGTLNIPYDAMMNDTLFNTLPSLQPDQCISVDIPFELSDTTGIGPVVVNATTSAKTALGSPVSSTPADALRLVEGCDDVSLACAGRVNVTLGPDCKADIVTSFN